MYRIITKKLSWLTVLVMAGVSTLAIAGNEPIKPSVIETQRAEAAFNSRSAMITRAIALQYDPPSADIGDPEKYYWPKAMARFKQFGLNDTMGNRYVSMFVDHSPFHFVLAGTSRLLYAFQDAPSMKANRLKFLKKMWARNDSYNAWTCEGTENHINMSRTSGYLFAQAALDYPNDFPDASEKMTLMKTWIKDWSKRIYQVGTGEWNTGIYTTYHIIGWLNLYDFAKDQEVKACAKAVLDYYATEMAFHNSYGATGGAELRGTGAGHSANTATAWLSWLWFGIPQQRIITAKTKGSEYIQSIHAITSSYRPDQAIIALASKTNLSGNYIGSRPIYHLHDGSNSFHQLYVGKSYTLGSAIIPYGGWTGTTMQVITWKLVAERGMNYLPLEVSGNGRFYDNWVGKGLNPFTQVVQHGNILVQMTKTPVKVKEITSKALKTVKSWDTLWRKDFDIRFPNEGYKHSVVNAGKPMLFENAGYISLPLGQKLNAIKAGNKTIHISTLGQTYLALVPLNGRNVKSDTADNRSILVDKGQLGELTGFIVITGDNSQFKTVQLFSKAVAKLGKSVIINGSEVSFKNLDNQTVTAKYQIGGQTEEALVDWGYGAIAPQVMITSPPFTQPVWPSGDGVGRWPSLLVNGKPAISPKPWPIVSGRGISFSDGVLKISAGNLSYSVDYSGSLPIFN